MIQQTYTNRKNTTQAHGSFENQGLSDWPGVVIQLRPAPDSADVFRRLCHLPHCIFFDSAMVDPLLGRYSFVAADPFKLLNATPDDASSWDRIQQCLQRYQAPQLPDLPPFQAGAAGLFSYDLSRGLERLPETQFDEFKIPGVMLGFYDVVAAFDHQQGRAWIISQGFPDTDSAMRQRRAKQRATQIEQLLTIAESKTVSLPALPSKKGEDSAKGSVAAGTLPASSLAPQFPVSNINGLISNFSRADYLAMVRRGIEYVYAGDVFQINLAQRLLYPSQDDSVSLYLRLRQRNSAPFAAYFDLGEFQIVSASPERFLQVRGRQVESRPIKGTRPRHLDSHTDRRAADTLLASEKDRAENIMIVDLLRNDLSRICLPTSVVVSELCRLERYSYVQHLVSVVRGELRDRFSPLDLMRAAFPGGSVTGAPKVRAMQIIAELEPTARGAYCGALGYIGFDGSMDSSVLIRTITAGRGWWQFPVGGGIVADSDPDREYEETWAKAEGMLRALQ